VWECWTKVRCVGSLRREMSSSRPALERRGASLAKLAPEVTRALYVRNLPFKITSEEMYDIFGRYGAIRQIRVGDKSDTRGTAFVVYEDIFDAKNALDHLSGFNVAGRYLVVLYYRPSKFASTDNELKRKELDEARRKYGLDKDKDKDKGKGKDKKAGTA